MFHAAHITPCIPLQGNYQLLQLPTRGRMLFVSLRGRRVEARYCRRCFLSFAVLLCAFSSFHAKLQAKTAASQPHNKTPTIIPGIYLHQQPAPSEQAHQPARLSLPPFQPLLSTHPDAEGSVPGILLYTWRNRFFTLLCTKHGLGLIGIHSRSRQQQQHQHG